MMDYADKVSSFVSNFDERQNDFDTIQSLTQQVGEAMERKGEQSIDRVGIQLPLAEAGKALLKKALGSAAKKAAPAEEKAPVEEYKPDLTPKTTDELAGDIEDNPFSFKNMGGESSTDATSTGAATTDATTAGAATTDATTAGASTTESTIAAAPAAATTTESAVSGGLSKVTAGVGEGEEVGEAVGLISLETIGSAIPILGAIAGIAVGIRDLIRGHHEERNTNQTFEMPKGNIDVPSYNPGVS
jgi:hypothetical protein